MKIAVLMTVHNRKDKTLDCLRALFNNEIPNGFDLEVFLVDDGSSDGTGEFVKAEFSNVNIIQGNGQLYWNRGMQKAWAVAASGKEYDYYLWLNDDSNIFSDTIRHLMGCSHAKQNRAIICGFLCSALDMRKTTYGGRLKEQILNPNGTMQAVDLMNGNVVLVPAEVYKAVGTLDPVFIHAIGDYDYGLRAKRKGFEIFSTEKYVGTCELNEKLPKWCYSDVPLVKRMKALYSPLGNAHPRYFFIYESRHFGLYTAVKHFISIHLRLIFPVLWKQ